MKLCSRFLVGAMVAVVGSLLAGCNDPHLVLETPRDQSVVTSPVAARISWSAINTLQNGMTITLDGQNANAQFTFGYAIVTNAATAMLPLQNGHHQLTASAELLDTDTQQYVGSTVTSNFDVVDAIFNLSIQPNPVVIAAGGAANATVSVVRTSSYADSIGVTLVGLPTGLTSTGTTIAANQNSAPLAFAADANTVPGVYNAMLTGTGSIPPSQTIMFQLQVLPPPPTFTQIYANYFDHSPAVTPGHCYNCHQSPPARNYFAPGPDKDGFYQGLVAANLIDLNNPAGSQLGSPTLSPLRWINPNGAMPKDQAVANDAAKNDILAWLNAGALNN